MCHHFFKCVSDYCYLFIYFENMASEKCAAEKTCGGVRLREELMDVSKCGHCMCF